MRSIPFLYCNFIHLSHTDLPSLYFNNLLKDPNVATFCNLLNPNSSSSYVEVILSCDLGWHRFAHRISDTISILSSCAWGFRPVVPRTPSILQLKIWLLKLFWQWTTFYVVIDHAYFEVYPDRWRNVNFGCSHSPRGTLDISLGIFSVQHPRNQQWF